MKCLCQREGARGRRQRIERRDVVFDQQRYAVQRTAHRAVATFGVERSCSLQGLWIHGEDRSEFRTRLIDFGDAIEISGDEGRGRQTLIQSCLECREPLLDGIKVCSPMAFVGIRDVELQSERSTEWQRTERGQKSPTFHEDVLESFCSRMSTMVFSIHAWASSLISRGSRPAVSMGGPMITRMLPGFFSKPRRGQ